jgi:hypothetical protein
MRRLFPFFISFTVTCTFFINFCAWIFQCGCHSLWAGAEAACNIHAQHGHHCPWCMHGYAGYSIVMIAMCGPQLAVSLVTRWSFFTRAMVAIALFPLMGAIAALCFGVVDSYWKP